MARRGALAQQLNAIESLASAEIVCLDKTGTLTEASLRVAHVTPAPGVDEQFLADALGRYAASSPSANATLDADRRGVPRQGRGRARAHPLLVEAALERRTRRCRRLRARCPGALRARPARRAGGGRAAERPPRRRAGDDRCLLRAVRRRPHTRICRRRMTSSCSASSSWPSACGLTLARPSRSSCARACS